LAWLGLAWLGLAWLGLACEISEFRLGKLAHIVQGLAVYRYLYN